MPQTYEQPATGIRLRYGDNLKLVEDHYLDRTFGITLLGAPQNGADDSRPLVLRVGVVQDAGPAGADAAAQRTLRDYEPAAIRRTGVEVAQQRAVALLGVPGREPTTHLYVVAYGQVYEIIYGKGDLDQEGQDLLAGLALVPPAQTRSPLNLPRAGDVLRQAPRAGSRAADADGAKNPDRLDPEGLVGSVSPREAATRGAAAAGCVDWPAGKFIQTPWTDAVNNGSGLARAGPSYYGQGLHQNCNTPGRLNDQQALDFAFNLGDPILAPATGRVVWAGWARAGWAGLGRIVVVDLGGGFWSMAAHLSSVEVSAGQSVKIDTVIGRAGGSGHLQDGFWGVHLHQGIYLNPSFVSASGGIHSGQSVQPHNVVHFGAGGGSYRDIESGQTLSF